MSRIVSVTSSATSSPLKSSTIQDLKETRSSISSLLMNKLRSCSCFPEETLDDDDLLILETFFDKYLNQIFLASFRSTSNATTSSSTATLTMTTVESGIKSITSSSVMDTGVQSSLENNWKWLTCLFKELHITLSGSMFLMNKCKHLILIPLMKSFHFLVNSPSTAFIIHDKDPRSMISSMKKLMILLLSFSVTPHEIQLFFSLIAQHRSVLHPSLVSSASSSPKNKNASPVKSRISSITSSPSKDSQETRDTVSGQKETKDEERCSDIHEEVCREEDEEDDIFQDNYFSVLTGCLSQPVLSKLPANFFAFTSYSCLSLPPVKSFPLKGFTLSTHIRLESLSHQMQSLNLLHPQAVHQQKQCKNDQRMFLFSFKSSSSPPLGFSAFFSQTSITTGSSNDASKEEHSFVKLTVCCFKGSSCPSLSHTLSFPFPVFQAGHSSPSTPSSPSHPSVGNEFIQLSLTFSPTALCLFINGELIESNCNDWTIAGVKTPFPSFDRCFIGCPFVSQVKGSASLQANPNDTGFRGQLTSLYLFSSVLSSSSVALLHSLEDVSNQSPSFGVNPSVCPPSIMTSITKGASTKNESEVLKSLREVNASLVCLYSPSSVNWPIVLQCVNGNTLSTPNSSTSNSGRSGQFDINSYYHVQVQVPPTSALTSHSLIQGNLEIVQRNLLIDSIQSLNQGLDVILDLLSQFIREGRVNEFSQLFSFALDLISNEKNHYFLEAAISSNFLKQVLSLLLCLETSKDRCVFLSFPSLFLHSLISILQTMIQDKKLETTRRSSSSSSSVHHHTVHPNGLLQRCMTVKEIESLESETDKNKKMRIECVKQILELFIFNSFLWSQLLLDEEDLQEDHHLPTKGELDTLVKPSTETNNDEMQSKSQSPLPSSSGMPNDSRVNDTIGKNDSALGNNNVYLEKNREETLSSLYSFISTQLLSMPSSQGMLLRRKRRSAFLLQVFNSLKNHFYHRKYPESFMMHDLSLEEVAEETRTGLGSHEREFLKKVLSDKRSFDRRERMVAVIRSNILVFIKSLLTKGSSVSTSQAPSSSTSSSSTSSSSTATAATTGTTVELLDANDNQSESGGKMMTGSASSTSSASRIPDHLLDSSAERSTTGNSGERVERSSFLDDDDGYFEEETNCILNYLSVTSKEILQRENSCKKSLLNVIDVLSLLNSLLIEIPSSMIPAFDTRKGIYVLFQVMNNTIRSSVESESDAEEKEVIRSLCLKILGSFLMRSTYKRKSQSMTSSHFSILYYMLSRDRSILTHSLYVNLMEITIEAPISSLYSLQSSHHQGNNQTNCRKKGRQNSSGRLNQGKDDSGKDLSDDDYYWSSSCDGDRDGDGRPASSSSLKEGSNSSASPSTIKIENPQMIKVIALLVVRNKQLANQFLKDLFTLLLDSRSNRRLILQMSVWQSWLISFLKIETNDERERKKREQTVISVFKLLLYHALRWEFGGWRVWIDSLAIIHSFLSREAFNKTYQESLYAEQQAHRRTSARLTSTLSANNGHVASEEEEDDKLEDERHHIRREVQQNQDNQQSNQGQKKRLATPTYRIPAFRWSSIHVQLLDSLLSAIITDINCFRKEAMMRANLNGSPTNLDTERDTNEAVILESILMNSDIYVINIIHLISQLTDSCILDAGGLLPLLAVATSSTTSSTGNKRQTSSLRKTPESPDASSSSTIVTTTSNNNASVSQTSAPSSSSCLRNKGGSLYEDDGRVDLMNESKATDLLLQLVFLADYLIFNSTLSNAASSSSSSTGVSLAELEAEKNMSSGGLLRQILRLVSLVAVKRVLVLKDRETTKQVSRRASQSSTAASTSKNKESEEHLKTTLETPDILTVESDSKDSSSEVDESDDVDDDLEDLNGGVDGICDSFLITSRHPKGASKFLKRYLEDHDEENDHLLLSVKDIQRLRATLYRSDASTSSSSTSSEKERTNSNFLALSTMYFLSVLLVSKYRDTLDVVSTANKARTSSTSSTNSKENDSSQQDYKNTSNEADLESMEKSLYPTVQFLKDIISDFEIFLSKSLLGSKGQTLLTKQLVKRIKSSDCSPLEVVMLLCAQEFQNSLQKNAGLAFIELINEGRLLSISMKEHVIRVGIEADFILSRIEREERDRDTLFKRESFLLEEKREKEVDLVQDVVASLSCPGVDASSLCPVSHLSSSSVRQSNRSSKRKTFRDLEEFLSEKRMVLFKEDFMMQERESKCSSTSSSGSSMTTMRATLPTGQSLPGSLVDPSSSALRASASSQTSSQLTNTAIVMHANHHQDFPARNCEVNGVSSEPVRDDHEVLVLKERVKALMDRMEALEKERDHAMDELESLKQEKTKSASQSESESELGGPTSVTVSSRVASSVMTTVSSASPRGDKKIGLDVTAFASTPTVDIISIEQTDASGEEVIKITTQPVVINEDNHLESNEIKAEESPHQDLQTETKTEESQVVVSSDSSLEDAKEEEATVEAVVLQPEVEGDIKQQ